MKEDSNIFDRNDPETWGLQLSGPHSGPISLGLLKLSRKAKIHPKSVFTKFLHK